MTPSRPPIRRDARSLKTARDPLAGVSASLARRTRHAISSRDVEELAHAIAGDRGRSSSNHARARREYNGERAIAEIKRILGAI